MMCIETQITGRDVLSAGRYNSRRESSVLVVSYRMALITRIHCAVTSKLNPLTQDVFYPINQQTYAPFYPTS